MFFIFSRELAAYELPVIRSISRAAECASTWISSLLRSVISVSSSCASDSDSEELPEAGAWALPKCLRKRCL